MSIGLGLLKSLIQENCSFSRLSEEGITREYFTESNEEILYTFLLNYSMNVGGLPQLDTAALQITPRSLFDALPTEPFPFWLNLVKSRHTTILFNRGVAEARTRIEQGSPEEAINSLGNLYLNLRTHTRQGVIDVIQMKRDAIDLHNQVQQSTSILGITFGFPFFDEISGGMQGGDLISIAGETGVGKTTIALHIARMAYLSGHSVLGLSTEMRLSQIGRKLLALDTRQSLQDLKMGDISCFGIDYALEMLNQEQAQTRDNFFRFLPGGIYSSVSDVILVTKEQNPDLLVLDGAYLLRSSRKGYSPRWENVMEVVETLKNFSLTEDIPILLIFQFNKQDPGTLGGIAGTIAISQLSSVAFSVEWEHRADAENPSQARYRIIKIMKGRDGESGSIRINFNFDRSEVSQDRILTGRILDRSIEDSLSEDPILPTDDPEVFEI